MLARARCTCQCTCVCVPSERYGDFVKIFKKSTGFSTTSKKFNRELVAELESEEILEYCFDGYFERSK